MELYLPTIYVFGLVHDQHPVFLEVWWEGKINVFRYIPLFCQSLQVMRLVIDVIATHLIEVATNISLINAE